MCTYVVAPIKIRRRPKKQGMCENDDFLNKAKAQIDYITAGNCHSDGGVLRFLIKLQRMVRKQCNTFGVMVAR